MSLNQMRILGIDVAKAKLDVARLPAFIGKPPPEIWELRAFVTRRDALEHMRTQEMNRLHVSCGQVSSGIEEHIAFIEKAIQDIDVEIQQKTDDDAKLKKRSRLRQQSPRWAVAKSVRER